MDILKEATSAYEKKWRNIENMVAPLCLIFWCITVITLFMISLKIGSIYMLWTVVGMFIVINEDNSYNGGIFQSILVLPILIWIGIIGGVFYLIKKLNKPTLAKIRKRKLKSL